MKKQEDDKLIEQVDPDIKLQEIRVEAEARSIGQYEMIERCYRDEQKYR